MRAIFQCLLTVCALATAMGAHATYPEKTITIVVPYAPGGAADALAREVAARMAIKLKATIIVDNKAGASGNIGTAAVARAQPDGYTLLYVATPYSVNPLLYEKMPFAEDALEPLALVAIAPNVLVVKADSPIKDVKDLVARAKAMPGKINFSSGGSGTVQRLASELFLQKLGLDMVHVAYKSGAPSILDVAGGQVDFTFATIAGTSGLVSGGKLRVLAVSSPERVKRLPNVPTVAETVLPGFEAFEWHGMLVPSGTPPAIVAQLNKAVRDVFADNEMKQRVDDMGIQGVGSTPADFAAFLKKDKAKWADVIRKGNIKLD
jgi:tripartite-type tricarboxylate transporter receptor subunit TctC